VLALDERLSALLEAVLHSKSAAMDGRIWTPPFFNVKEQSTKAGAAIQDGSHK